MVKLTRVVPFVVMGLTCALTACGAEADAPRQLEALPAPPSRASAPAEDDAPAGASETLEARESERPLTGEAPPPAPEAPTTLRGQLARTATVDFGGRPYCEYDVTLEDVDLVLEVLPSGEITRATLSNAMVERPASSCPYTGQPRKQMSFTLARATAISAGSTSIELSGATTNSPKTRAVVVLDRTVNDSRATVTWKRIDVSAPLDWEVEATITLARR